MKKNGKGFLCAGLCLLVLFAIWTILIQAIDVRSAGETGTEIGFATFNCRFHQMTGVHRSLYLITDWMGLVPVMVCLVFGWIGFYQLIRRKSLLKVDLDLIYLGMYYGLVIVGYIIFEVIPINYRPILIDGAAEASYPSSTTLLVLSVMPTLVFQADRRLRKAKVKKLIGILTMAFSAFMVSGRMISGVHWVTDIIGAVLLSSGLFFVYKAVVLLACNGQK